MEEVILPHFDDVKLIYTKGSHKKVRWNCPECNRERIGMFKMVLTVKRCIFCSNHNTAVARNMGGVRNPFHGKKHTPETIAKISGTQNANWKGGLEKYKCKECGKQLSDQRAEYCVGHHQSGDRNRLWNPTYDREKREHLRIMPEYIIWAKAVKARDNFICQKCNDPKAIPIHSHHIQPYSRFPELRYELSNGITLCKSCHFGFHEEHGKTAGKESFEQWFSKKKEPVEA